VRGDVLQVVFDFPTGALNCVCVGKTPGTRDGAKLKRGRNVTTRIGDLPLFSVQCLVLTRRLPLTLRTWAVVGASANPTGRATARPNILRRILNDASSTESSEVCHDEFKACDDDSHCSSCLEIGEDTQCEVRDTLIHPDHCDKVWGVVCCVFKNDEKTMAGCADNGKLHGVIGKCLFRACFGPTWAYSRYVRRIW